MTLRGRSLGTSVSRRRSVKLPTGCVAAMIFALPLACAEPVPIALSALRHDEGDTALVDEAVAILGVEWEPSTRSRGTVHLTLIDGDPSDTTQFDSAGVTVIGQRRCWKAVIALRHPTIVAHELGHALGLDHVCEAPCPSELAENLMNGETSLGTELSDEQTETIDRERGRLTRCR